ncbi:MAG: type II toxin-antitoxin system RelE/ParE family toxin [Nodosilinea sp.]
MSYGVSILRRAQKELGNLPAGAFGRVRDALRALADEPRPAGCKKLHGREGWRIRVGDYRILYKVDDNQQTVEVFHVGHRRDVYR